MIPPSLPSVLAGQHVLKNGLPVRIRPIQPGDEPLLEAFHRGLSKDAVYHRYFSPFPLAQRITPERLADICEANQKGHCVLVVLRAEAAEDVGKIIGIGRMNRLPDLLRGELALLVGDAWQRQGLGRHLRGLLLDWARRQGFTVVTATILGDNREMLQLCREAGFTFTHIPGAAECEAELRLQT